MAESNREQELEQRTSELERQLAVVQQAAMTAETNELTLHRRLSPYMDAEIANRDAEIEELKANLAEAEASQKNGEVIPDVVWEGVPDGE